VIGRVKTYEAIIKGNNIPEPGIPESFKVLLKELQSLALDVKVLREDMSEVEIKESIDYDLSGFRYDLDDNKNANYESDASLGAMGYQKQEFDTESGELVAVEEEVAVDEEIIETVEE
jgi:DNA-directed RNA polymerase subunit beta